MRRFRRHDRATQQPPMRYDEAALHVRAYVAMATVDGDVRTGELECLVELVDSLGTVGTRGRLLMLMRMLLDAPPFAEDVLDALAASPLRGASARALRRALRRIAKADGRMTLEEANFEAQVLDVLRDPARIIEAVV